jgi:HlyD family secretion protein
MRQKRLLSVAAGALVISLAAGGVQLRLFGRAGDADVLRASGTVQATEAQVGFQAAGRIAGIGVREGDRVEAGAEIAVLDRAEAEARRAQAKAGVQAARALLRELESGARREELAQARAALEGARQKLADAERDHARAQTLFAGGAVSREALDKAGLALRLAGSQEAQALEQLRLLEAGPRRERIEAQRAQLAQAEAALRSIDALLENLTVRAPFAGVVTVRHREPGEVAPAGSPVLTLMDPADRWVRIYVPGDRIGAVKLGTGAQITADTYPGRSYPGEVIFIASEAEFTPKNVQTTEERVKLVYAVKVRISGDPGHELKPGMPADVRLELAQEGS